MTTTFRMADHSNWADNIEWFRMPDETGRGQIYGHMRQRPQAGDRILCHMQSGKDAIFDVLADDAWYPHNPPDQFFVHVQFSGYEDEGRTMLNPAIRESSEATDTPPGRWQKWEMECEGCGQIHGLRLHLDEAIINTPGYQDAREAMHAKLARTVEACTDYRPEWAQG
jgi:hypothetical protein